MWHTGLNMHNVNGLAPWGVEAAEQDAAGLQFDESTDLMLLDWVRVLTRDWPGAAEELRETLGENPGRISRAYREMLSGYSASPREVLKVAAVVPNGHQGLVAANRIPFLSFCAHHFLPFFGSVDIVYEPDTQIVGIGKIPRLVACRARRFQLQELLVKELSEDMMTYAEAKGVYVRSSAQHTCVCYRGPAQTTVVNTATYSLGSLGPPERFEEVRMAMRVPAA